MKRTIFLIQAILFSCLVNAQEGNRGPSNGSVVVPSETRERLREIYEDRAFSARSVHAKWIPDGSAYMVLESETGKDSQVLVSYDAKSGKSTEVISAVQLTSTGESGQFVIRDYEFSPDGNHILIEADRLDEGDKDPVHWMLEWKSGTLQQVVAGRDSRISPDKQKILFSDKGNLYVYSLPEKQTIPLTNDAVEGSIYNGRASWSPDGSRILFVRSDASSVRLRSSLVPGDPSYPEVEEKRFARVGGTITSLRVGVVDASGEETRWLSVPVPSEGYYLGEVSWAGNSHQVLVEKLSRGRDKREFLLADVNNGKITSIFEESDPAWVVASYNKNGGLEWINKHSAFVVLSEKDGWRHAYVYSRDGEEQALLTPGESEIIERLKVDHEKGWFYYIASPENGTQKYLYQVAVDGTGKARRITPADQPGTHSYNISPDSKWAIHTYSTINTPPVTELLQLPEHKLVRVLEDNKELRDKVASLDFQATELLKLDIGEGVVMDAWMIKPNDFDPTRKYPVFVYVYGEPHGQTVNDVWGNAMNDYHRVIADLGYLVVSIDNRGTPCPKGAAWRRVISGQLGPLSTEEQAAGLKELARTRSYVDLSRVGIWGWSGGGSNTLNAMFRKPDVYHVGIAVAPKPQPHLYNAWFQEIYMKTQELNPEGYRESAPINFAEGLQGDLLIVHGSGETNTHVQITEGLVDRLIELGKQFDYMCYPNRDHGIRKGEGTSLHLRIHMARYLLNHLPPGPR